MISVGLTGNIGAGKTLVASIFKSLEIPVFNADREASQLFLKTEVIEAISKEISQNVFINGKIDPKLLAEIVFNDRDKLLRLNAIIHPLVFQMFDEWSRKQQAPYCIMESAIIFEYQLEDKFDFTIAVSAREDIRLERVISRDGVSVDQVKERMKNQLSEDLIRQKADFTIENNGNEFLIPQVIEIHKTLSEVQ